MPSLTSIARNPAPDGARVMSLTTSDAVKLRAAWWPGTIAAKGTVLVLQGRTECIEKYFETIGELLTRGYAVATFDWRGQGGSDRALGDRHKGHVRDFTEYHLDMDAFIDSCVKPNLPQPYMLLAHSMGAHIALRYVHDGPQLFTRAVLCSPMAYINTAPLPDGIARAIAWAGCAIGFADSFVPRGKAYQRDSEPFAVNRLTGDPARFARNADILDANPDLAIGSPTLGWLDAAYRSMAVSLEQKFCAAIKTPALMVYGSDERVSLPYYQVLLAARLGNCVSLCITGARHEILQETDAIRTQFWAGFDKFLSS